MRYLTWPVLVLASSGWLLAAEVPGEVKALRLARKAEGERVEILYRFADDEEHQSLITRAVRRGDDAAKAWKEFDKSANPVVVVARSPFGGGETDSTYWPPGVKPELLRDVAGPLNQAGLKVEFPEVPAAAAGQEPPQPAEKPFPKEGFSEDYEFVLLVGLHHEPSPYGGTRRTAEGKVIYSRGSRVNAWAILFHSPTAAGFWATTALAQVGYQGVADPLNAAAEAALSRLDFSDIGTHNVPDHISRLPELRELPAVDAAAMLVQTQRADAVQAVVKFAMSETGYKTTAPVLRFYSDQGTAQDFRIAPEYAARRKFALVSQRAMLRLLLLEQLRGLRGVQGCLLAAIVPRMEDLDIGPIGQEYAGRLGPLGGDDEVVLIGELANSDPNRVFSRNQVAAVRNLGRCRTHIEEAMVVAKMYAERQTPPPPRGREPRGDPLKAAGQAALAELSQAKIELRKRAAQQP